MIAIKHVGNVERKIDICTLSVPDAFDSNVFVADVGLDLCSVDTCVRGSEAEFAVALGEGMEAAA